MQLTQSGATLYKATSQAFNTLLQALNEIQTEELAGQLTVTSTQSFASLWIMPRLYKFSIKHPDIKIKVLGSNQIDDLQQSHIDLAIRFSQQANFKSNDELTYEPFGEDFIYPVCSPQVYEQMSLSKPQDLLKCWLVSLTIPGSFTWQSWFETAKVKNYQKHQLWTEVTSSDLALSAVLSGHGCALAATAIYSQYVDVGKLIVPFDIPHSKSFKRFLVYETNSSKKARIQLFMNWLREEMAESE